MSTRAFAGILAIVVGICMVVLESMTESLDLLPTEGGLLIAGVGLFLITIDQK